MKENLKYRFAGVSDAAILAELNLQLIRDEGHRNPMSVDDLTVRMSIWLNGQYQAVLFKEFDQIVGYALYRHEPDFVYLRHLFVVADRRRQGIGRHALEWLRQSAWPTAKRIRVEVLFKNENALAFWRSVGFGEYCVTLEHQFPESGTN
ncbi:GNAT family N-acetyltransferase [Schlesneria paludicola]|uniref:GNAT family N-acetyltransferase n=1 Tax=Schlesneria paludicola TaxID=360056 RepID=UPI00029B235A|nr:GNAT family N-acetyltransferase [Schlesneria paludicola]